MISIKELECLLDFTDATAATPARHADRRWHVPGGTGATRRAERLRRAPSNWSVVKTRSGHLPSWAEAAAPRKEPKTRGARRRAAVELGSAVVSPRVLKNCGSVRGI